jgi:hypothetical protein
VALLSRGRGYELRPNPGLRLATCTSDRRDIVPRLVRRAPWAQPCELSYSGIEQDHPLHGTSEL